MIVMIIIVILIGILLPALSGIKKKSMKVQSQAQCNALATASEAYLIQFRAPPGYLPEIYWQSWSPSSPTANESAVISLLGGVVNASVAGGVTWTVPTNTYYTSTIYINPQQIGSGTFYPTGGTARTFGAFYSPKATELVSVTGTAGTGTDITNATPMVHFVDVSSGVPLLYYRAIAGSTNASAVADGIVAPPTQPTNSFNRIANANYLYGTSIKGWYNQKKSMLSDNTISGGNATGGAGTTAANACVNLSYVLTSRTLGLTVRKGDYAWLSPGPDGIYFAYDQLATPVTQFTAFSQIDSFDDVQSSGGL